jgi:hypothetical protein
MHEISMKRVSGICTRVQEFGINESEEEIEGFSK